MRSKLEVTSPRRVKVALSNVKEELKRENIAGKERFHTHKHTVL